MKTFQVIEIEVKKQLEFDLKTFELIFQNVWFGLVKYDLVWSRLLWFDKSYLVDSVWLIHRQTNKQTTFFLFNLSFSPQINLISLFVFSLFLCSNKQNKIIIQFFLFVTRKKQRKSKQTHQNYLWGGAEIEC